MHCKGCMEGGARALLTEIAPGSLSAIARLLASLQHLGSPAQGRA
jgi:hypothetical protein